jgi:hypothetical protein
VAHHGYEISASALVECVRDYADLTGEVDTPCKAVLVKVGVDGVHALAQLIESERHSDSELVSCFAAELLASFKHPSVVPVLLRVLAEPGTVYPDEVRESVVNFAPGNTALLDPAFLSACRELRRTWRTAGCGIQMLDQFLSWAERTTYAQQRDGRRSLGTITTVGSDERNGKTGNVAAARGPVRKRVGTGR